MKSKLTCLVACLVFVSGTTGCKKVAKLLGKDVVQDLAEAAGSADDESQATMGQYATGYNILIDDPKECLTEYFDDVPLEGPQTGEKYSFFPSHTRGVIELKKAKESFEAAKKSAPKELEHLAPLADAALAVTEKSCEVFEGVHKYYDAEDFKDDGGKKGKKLHDEMVALAKQAEKDLQAFEDALSEIETRQSKAEIAKFEKDKSYSYWFRLFNFEAKMVVEAQDPKEFEKRFASLDKAYSGLKSFADGKGDSLQAAFESFLGQADGYHSIAKKLVRAMGEGEPDERELVNLRNQLTSGYNTLVSVGNSMRELEANDLLK